MRTVEPSDDRRMLSSSVDRPILVPVVSVVSVVPVLPVESLPVAESDWRWVVEFMVPGTVAPEGLAGPLPWFEIGFWLCASEFDLSDDVFWAKATLEAPITDSEQAAAINSREVFMEFLLGDY